MIRCLQGQVFRRRGQRHIVLQGHQLLRQGQPWQEFTQVFADLALDPGRIVDHPGQRAVLAEPLDGGPGADLGHPGHVIHAVAHERQIIDDAFGRQAELFDHPRAIQIIIVHGVDQMDALVDDLREVLVAGRDDGLDVPLAGLARQGRDHIIGLDAIDAEQRDAQRADNLVQRPDLAGQLIRHGRPVGLVVGKQIIAEGAALGVKDHREIIRPALGQVFSDHIDDAVDRARRRARPIAQAAHGVKGPEQIIRTVHQHHRPVYHGGLPRVIAASLVAGL